jgi:hypothetical protein
MVTNSRIIRIGAGAGFAGDRIDPAVDLAARGKLDYLVFECLAERTIALAQAAKLADPSAGYDSLLDARMRAVLPAAHANGVRIISNMGGANPIAAAKRIAEIARSIGLRELKIAAVTGDDVLAAIRKGNYYFLERAGTVRDLGDRLISANAYLGAEPIVQALREGADIVITGRTADPSLFLAPIMHEFDWRTDDWERIGRGTAIGHLLECAGQLSGGYFADPGFKDVHDLASLGFPIAEVMADGTAIFTKLPDTGGKVSVATCTEQLLYEIHDPGSYITPDVIANFSDIVFEEIAPNRVKLQGGGGRARPSDFKVSIGFDGGIIGEGQITYAGANAIPRAQLALDIVKARLVHRNFKFDDLRFDLIGVNSAWKNSSTPQAISEVRARVAGRSYKLEDVTAVGSEVEALYTNGPAGGGGVTRSVRQSTAILSTLIPREYVEPQVHFECVS